MLSYLQLAQFFVASLEVLVRQQKLPFGLLAAQPVLIQPPLNNLFQMTTLSRQHHLEWCWNPLPDLLQKHIMLEIRHLLIHCSVIMPRNIQMILLKNVPVSCCLIISDTCWRCVINCDALNLATTPFKTSLQIEGNTFSS